MKNFKILLIFLLSLFLFQGVFAISTYNAQGDFSVVVDSQKDTVFNDNINSNFNFKVQNLKSYSQTFSILIDKQNGWDVDLSKKYFTLNPNEEKEISVNFSSNSDFDYTPKVVSPDVIKISQRKNYIGSSQFPVVIKGKSENISLKYELYIKKPKEPEVSFNINLATSKLSPIKPLRYTIKAENITTDVTAFVRVELGNEIISEFTDKFTQENNYKIYEKQIPKDFNSGIYDSKITVRVKNSDGKSVLEWYNNMQLEIVPYNDLSAIKNRNMGFFEDTYSIKIINNGNQKNVYVKDVKVGFFKSMLFSTNIEDYYRTEDGIRYKIKLNKGEKKDLVYSFNYVALYILLTVLLILAGYVYIRKTSNPLDIETKLYDIKKVEHEGVKSLKVRIGFENIKSHEIENLRLIFRMPSYLQVKDESFLLTEPKKVLKGKAQFKLIWEFKNFEQYDSRIIGFQLVNKKGVLGDIKLPDIECEVKVYGKQRKYYGSFKTIKG